MAKLKVSIVVNFVTPYRAIFYEKLFCDAAVDYHIYCHIPPENLNIKSSHNIFDNLTIMRGFFLWTESLVITLLPWRNILASDIVIVEGNPRYISMVILAAFLKLAKRKVIVWAMIKSFRNSTLGLKIRIAWYKKFDRLLVYSDKECKDLAGYGYGGVAIGINNGIDSEKNNIIARKWDTLKLKAWQVKMGINQRRVLLSCARLEEKNRFEEIIEVLPSLLAVNPNLIWVVIGDGGARERLERLAVANNTRDNVIFLGEIFEEEELAPWFLSSVILIHPGAIGLTLLHAFSYGLPVVTHNNADHHGPEFSAFKNNVTGYLYNEGSRVELARCIDRILTDDCIRGRMSSESKEVVLKDYNLNVMVNRFKSIIGYHY